MTTLSVNNNLISQNAQNERLEDFVKNMILEHGDKKIMTSLVLDGREHPYNEGQTGGFLNRMVSEYKSIELTFKTSLELSFEALESCSLYIDHIVTRVSQVVKLYQEEVYSEANEGFGEIIDSMDLFVQLILKVQGTFKEHNLKSEQLNKEIQKLEIHLLSIMKALVPAKEKGDIIMLSDLLEYELVDNLTQWKIKAIPALKKLRST